MRRKQFSDIYSQRDCVHTLDSIHERDTQQFCSSKYLQAPCSKKYRVSRWENKGEVAYLNSFCCSSLQNYTTWPLYIIGIFTLLGFLAVLVATLFNYFISQKDEYIKHQRVNNMFNWLLLGLILLALLIFGLYW